MTPEEELLLKDLCGRLPYGVKIQTPTNCWTSEEGICELKEIFKGDDGLFRIGDVGTLIEYSKPYLFPLSSMTEEQEEELKNIYYNIFNGMFQYTERIFDGIPFSKMKYFPYQIEEFFNRNHFDYRGLIPQGLAKDATNLNIY
jgi:hypothetical protein